jgi:hypothetical protein
MQNIADEVEGLAGQYFERNHEHVSFVLAVLSAAIRQGDLAAYVDVVGNFLKEKATATFCFSLRKSLDAQKESTVSYLIKAMKTVIWRDKILAPSLMVYRNTNRYALLLYDGGMLEAVASINDAQVPLKDDEIIIKGYSENDGLFEALLEAGVIEDLHRTVPDGWERAKIARLLI